MPVMCFLMWKSKAVAAIKITQHAQTSVYHFVPMLDFTHPLTDDELYKKYGLTPKEETYIESMVKAME